MGEFPASRLRDVEVLTLFAYPSRLENNTILPFASNLYPWRIFLIMG